MLHEDMANSNADKIQQKQIDTNFSDTEFSVPVLALHRECDMTRVVQLRSAMELDNPLAGRIDGPLPDGAVLKLDIAGELAAK